MADFSRRQYSGSVDSPLSHASAAADMEEDTAVKGTEGAAASATATAVEVVIVAEVVTDISWPHNCCCKRLERILLDASN
jgi:hypothetical protein